MNNNYVISKSISGEDIKRLRSILGMTQTQFAHFVNCSKRTVENWEMKSGEIHGPIVTLSEILFRKPEWAQMLEIPDNELKLRLWYMYKNIVCTVIDVDEPNRKVTIHNYIDDPLYKAFGVNDSPDFEDYEEFIESRCFPRSRDKIKLELKKLDIPFYDPIMIIEKTEGRMTEDHFWIKLERR